MIVLQALLRFYKFFYTTWFIRICPANLFLADFVAGETLALMFANFRTFGHEEFQIKFYAGLDKVSKEIVKICDMTVWQPPLVSPALPSATQLHNGGFVVHKPLGSGGFGITYLSTDLNLQRDVAIKEFFPAGCTRIENRVVASDPAEFTATKTNFLEEARTLARFNHPGIVKVLSVFEENGTAYMVMEFLRGKTLRQIVEQDGILPEDQALRYIRQLGNALQQVHAAHLVHGDVKPDNVIVNNQGRAVLLDFGLNKKIEAAGNLQTRPLSMAQPYGTDGFAPPEQYLRHYKADFSTDIYALGATLYFLVTGLSPTSAPQRALGEPLLEPQSANPHISSRVNTAILQAMELQEERRPQTLQSFFQQLKPPTQTQNQTQSNPIPQQTPATPVTTNQSWPQTPPQTSPAPAPPQSTYQTLICPNCSASNPGGNLNCVVCNALLTTKPQLRSTFTLPTNPPQELDLNNIGSVIVLIGGGLLFGGLSGITMGFVLEEHLLITVLLGSIVGAIASLVFVFATGLEGVERKIAFSVATGLVGVLTGVMVGAFTSTIAGVMICSAIGALICGYVGATDKTL